MSNSPEKVEPAFLWDMNGVIIDDEPIHEQAFRDSIKQVLGLDLPNQEYELYFFGKTDRQGVLDFCLGRLEQGIIDERTVLNICDLKNEFYAKNATTEMKVFADAVNLLLALQSDGYKQYIVTGSNRGETEIALSLLPDVFSGSVASEDYEGSKPDPDPYLAGATLASKDPRDCIVFEDSLAGIRAGKAAGCTTIGIDNGFQTSYQIRMMSESSDGIFMLSEINPKLVLDIHNCGGRPNVLGDTTLRISTGPPSGFTI